MQNRRIGIFIAVAIVGAVTDLLTKWWAERSLQQGGRPIIPGFLSLTYDTNTGAAFGIFQGASWGPPLLTAISIAAGAFIIYLAIRFRDAPMIAPVALGLVLGGVIGNVSDRITNDGHVRDFILLYYKDLHWPVFNLADSFITVGVLILLVFSPWKSAEEQKRESSPASS